MTLIKSIEEDGIQKEPLFVGTGKNLLQIGFFSVSKTRDNKKSPKDEKVVKLSRLETDAVNSHVELLVAKKVGLPTTTDLTKYLAFLDLVQERFIFNKKPIKNPIKFTNYELLNRIGLSIRGGKKNSTGDEIKEWLLRMKSTTVHFIAFDEKRSGGDIVSVFDRAIYFGEKLDDGTTADCNYVWLSNWERENLMSKSLVPVDLTTYRQLKNNTAKLLVPHLQIWLYAARHNPPFIKNYDDFCNLLGLQQYSGENEIVRALTPAMNELKKYEYIKKWTVTGARRTGYKISIWHGEKFSRDLKIFFVIKGGGQAANDKDAPPLPETNAPKSGLKLLPELKQGAAALTDEQRILFDRLIAKELDERSAAEIVLTREPEDVELIIRYCEHLFIQNPEKYPSKRGYLFTLLKDITFRVPESFKTEEGWREKNAREIEAEREIRDREAERFDWLQTQFDEFCFQQAVKEFKPDYEKFEKSYEKGNRIWESVLTDLRGKLNEQIFNAWFAPVKCAGMIEDSRTLQIAATVINRDWISSYYADALAQTLTKLELDDYEISWIVRDSNADDADAEKENEFFFYRLILINEFREKTELNFEKFCEQNEMELEEKFKAYFNAHK